MYCIILWIIIRTGKSSLSLRKQMFPIIFVFVSLMLLEDAHENVYDDAGWGGWEEIIVRCDVTCV